MARIRSLKPEFWTSEQIAECSPNARLLFIGIWSFADDSGIHKASLKRLKMEVFPSDAFDIPTVGVWVEELINAELVEHYKVEANAYWRVTGWTKHQRIDQPTYRHPCRMAQSLPAFSVARRARIRRTFAERLTTVPRGRGVERNGVKASHLAVTRPNPLHGSRPRRSSMTVHTSASSRSTTNCCQPCAMCGTGLLHAANCCEGGGARTPTIAPWIGGAGFSRT